MLRDTKQGNLRLPVLITMNKYEVKWDEMAHN